MLRRELPKSWGKKGKKTNTGNGKVAHVSWEVSVHHHHSEQKNCDVTVRHTLDS